MRNNVSRLVMIGIAALMLCGGAVAQQANTLAPQEQQDGWRLLFNGKNFDGWHSYLQQGVAKDWSVRHGAIVLRKDNAGPPADSADLVTDQEFENFDLKLEWKAKPCIDSGVMFYVHESPKYKQPYDTGPEMQIADLACTKPDSRKLMERAGDLFDLISDKVEWVRPAGEWNQYEIIADHGHVQFLMNGHKVIDFQMWGERWKTLIAGTKFSRMPGFGTFRQGHIALQGSEVKGDSKTKIWFRNIKIKKL